MISMGDVVRYARTGFDIKLSQRDYIRINKSRKFLELLLKYNPKMYGVNYPFGHRVDQPLTPEQMKNLSRNLIASMISGSGEYLPLECSRAATYARINSLIIGYSGIRQSTIDRWVELSNEGIFPLIPKIGSCGASGDLIPLSYCAGMLMGLDTVKVVKDGKIFSASELGDPIELVDKEGIGLINGTSASAGVASLALSDTKKLLYVACLLTAFYVQVIKGSTEPFWSYVHKIKPHPGQIKIAKIIYNLCSDSKLTKVINRFLIDIRNKRDEVDEGLLQDCYEVRCAAQLLGAVYDFVDYAEKVLNIELSSVSDNPIINSYDKMYAHGGNFFGKHITLAMDNCVFALYNIVDLLDMQFHGLLDTMHNRGLPSGLVIDNSDATMGFQSLQLSHTAGVVEIDTRPYSILSRWTDGFNQKITSMSMGASVRTYESVGKVYDSCSKLLLALCQAADFRGPEKLSPNIKVLYDSVRRKVPVLTGDRGMEQNIKEVRKILEDIKYENVDGRS